MDAAAAAGRRLRPAALLSETQNWRVGDAALPRTTDLPFRFRALSVRISVAAAVPRCTPMSDDAELLRLYAEEKSEEAFAQLVREHLDFVYGVALRRTDGQSALAGDIAQTVFTDLARKATELRRHPSLRAWLFRSTRYAAAQAVRAEQRRVAREQEAHRMQELTHLSANDSRWSDLRPMIEDVLDELPERDRVAVWLRICEGRTFAEVGAKLAASEDAVRVRVDRALEKMRAALSRRGIASTTAALTTALAQEGAVLTPAGLAGSVAGTALAGASAGGGILAGTGLSALMSTTKISSWAAVAADARAAAGVGNAHEPVCHEPRAPGRNDGSD